MRKIAIIGGGIFGCCAALKISEDSNNVVDLYETSPHILAGASGFNQYRVHAGYHYPRSKETALQSLVARQKFIDEFRNAILPESISHYYCIVKDGSLTSADQYIRFLLDVGLQFRIQPELDWIDNSKIDLAITAVEHLYDPNVLHKILRDRLYDSKVQVLTNRSFLPEMKGNYDVVINATYANINRFVPENERIEYQFEICQKPIVRLNKEWKNRSVVLLDGPFFCIDPFLKNQEFHVLGHVKNAILHSNVGMFPEIPIDLKDKVYSENVMSIDHFIPDIKNFFPDIEIEPSNSMITLRTVLPDRDHDDFRPSYITKHSDSLYSIFSGKISTSIQIAEAIAKVI